MSGRVISTFDAIIPLIVCFVSICLFSFSTVINLTVPCCDVSLSQNVTRSNKWYKMFGQNPKKIIKQMSNTHLHTKLLNVFEMDFLISFPSKQLNLSHRFGILCKS